MVVMGWRRERVIDKTLRKLSRQRVAVILQPGDVWVVEKAVGYDDETDAALRTCYLRGWVEPVAQAVPKGELTPEGELPAGPPFTRRGPVYRLTEAGWAAINRSHRWVVASWLVALVSLVASVVGIVASRLFPG